MSLASCYPALVAQLRSSPHVVKAALDARLLSPADLDPGCSAQVTAFGTYYLPSHPGTRCPRRLLDRLHAADLWRCCGTPDVTADLARHLGTDGSTLPPTHSPTASQVTASPHPERGAP